MLDALGRNIRYLRISVTDRCNLRCRYCMPAEGVEWVDHSAILTYEQITRLVGLFAAMGVEKVRLTGGEPLVRKGLHSLVRSIKQVPGIRRVYLTTNGLLLADQLPGLLDAGLDGVNLSLDTLDRAQFEALTRRDELDRALAGLNAALAAPGLTVKVNCVPSGENDDQLVPLAALARDWELAVRFIELMPMGPCAAWPKERFLPVTEILNRFPALEEIEPNGVARRYRLPGAMGAVGLITPMSHEFCGACRRIRVTADGKLKGCLHSREEISLRGLHGRELEDAILRGILHKPKGHHLTEHASDTPRTMNEIGG